MVSSASSSIRCARQRSELGNSKAPPPSRIATSPRGRCCGRRRAWPPRPKRRAAKRRPWTIGVANSAATDMTTVLLRMAWFCRALRPAASRAGHRGGRRRTCRTALHLEGQQRPCGWRRVRERRASGRALWRGPVLVGGGTKRDRGGGSGAGASEEENESGARERGRSSATLVMISRRGARRGREAVDGDHFAAFDGHGALVEFVDGVGEGDELASERAHLRDLRRGTASADERAADKAGRRFGPSPGRGGSISTRRRAGARRRCASSACNRRPTYASGGGATRRKEGRARGRTGCRAWPSSPGAPAGGPRG